MPWLLSVDWILALYRALWLSWSGDLSSGGAQPKLRPRAMTAPARPRVEPLVPEDASDWDGDNESVVVHFRKDGRL